MTKTADPGKQPGGLFGGGLDAERHGAGKASPRGRNAFSVGRKAETCGYRGKEQP